MMLKNQLLIFTVLLVIIQSQSKPSHRAEISDTVLFQLFTRRNPNAPQILELNNDAILAASNFDTNLPVKIFAHGWVGFPNQGYQSASNWLQVEDCNAISVDWSVLAAGDYDPVAANNVTIAGATLGAFVDYLVNKGTPLSSFHLVGFSMGAHVVGNAGGAVTVGKVPRITGLDPASVGFPLESPETTLDRSDAVFVDIIHTDIAYIIQTGHSDFYPNGGVAPQPGCTDCSHGRAVTYYEESILSTEGFWARECTSYEVFLAGTCDNNRSIRMGEPTPTNVQGTFYLRTNGESPFAQGPI